MPKPYLFVPLGLALSEKQTPRVVENIEKPKKQMEALESSVVLRRQTFLCDSTPGAGASTSGCFSPTSVQFKGEINDALPRKRHQKRHLEFCIA